MNTHNLFRLNANSLVVTGNSRLAEWIRMNYDTRQRQSGLSAWPSITVLPLRSWLLRLWQSYSFGPAQLLTDWQEQCIWWQIIQKNEKTVQSVRQAWQSLHLWQIPLQRVKNNAIDSVEVSLLIEWTEVFIQLCNQNQWLSEVELPQYLSARCSSVDLTWPKQIVVAGFDELPPAYQHFLTTAQHFTQVTYLVNDHPLYPYQTTTFPDIHSEINAMASWIKVQRELYPKQTIGCIVPQLAKYRQPLARILHISEDKNLSQSSMIAIGLKILLLDIDTASVAELAELHLSPYLSVNEADLNMGAWLNAALGTANLSQSPWPLLFNSIAHQQTLYPSNTWLKRWRAFLALHRSEVLLKPSDWVAHFLDQLNALQWPGGRALNEQECAIQSRWLELFTDLASLDSFSGLISHDTALRWLHQLTRQTIVKSQSNSPITILGPSESCDFQFDALWVMGLDDQSWPPPAQPNPFLPYILQIQEQLPHSCPQRELSYAKQVTHRWLRCAPLIWISCSASQPDQVPRLSALINPSPGMPSISPLPSLAEIMLAQSSRESYEDYYGPPMPAAEHIFGGSAVLTQQAECPFRAFATFRLQAIALPEPILGISMMDRGISVHAILEKIWQVIRTHHALIHLTDDELHNLIEQTVTEASANNSDTPLWQIEKNRLIDLIKTWLQEEKKRPPFSIMALETQRHANIAGLKLTIKIDRIDQLRDGSLLIIDYKTGHTSITAWSGDRPQQLQLPLYCLYGVEGLSEELSAITFAQLRPNEMGFKGIGNEINKDFFPAGIKFIDKDSWQQLLDHWRAILQKLSTDFRNGYAAADPANEGLPCETCDLQTLCRIHSI